MQILANFIPSDFNHSSSVTTMDQQRILETLSGGKRKPSFDHSSIKFDLIPKETIENIQNSFGKSETSPKKKIQRVDSRRGSFDGRRNSFEGKIAPLTFQEFEQKVFPNTEKKREHIETIQPVVTHKALKPFIGQNKYPKLQHNQEHSFGSHISHSSQSSSTSTRSTPVINDRISTSSTSSTTPHLPVVSNAANQTIKLPDYSPGKSNVVNSLLSGVEPTKNINQDTSLQILPETTESPVLSGVVYIMNDQKSLAWSFGTQLRGTKSEDQNIVGLGILGNKEVIYKAPRLPGWNPNWEYSICSQLAETLPHLTHFAKAISVTRMTLKCDKKNLALPQHPRTNDPSRTCNMLLQRYIPGVTLGEFVKMDNSYRKLFSSIFQVLKAIEAAQFWMGYTHYDLHANNVKIKQTKTKNKYFLYDTLDEKSDPFAVYSYGMKAVIYDNEFSHAVTMDGHNLDSSFVHLCRSYDPSSSDKSIDAIRFVTSILTFYNECRPDNYIRVMRDKIVNSVNSHGCGVLNDMGVFEQTSDAIRQSVLESLRDRPEKEMKYANKWLYCIISLLTHDVKLPLEKRVEQPDTSYLVTVIKCLFQINCKYSEHRFRILYELVCKRTSQDLKMIMNELNMQVDDFDSWFNLISDAIVKSIPHIESALYFATRENKQRRMEQHELDYTPTKMIKLILEDYQKIEPITDDMIIEWITKTRKTKISTKVFPKDVLDSINSATDITEFSKRLKQAVLNYNH